MYRYEHRLPTERGLLSTGMLSMSTGVRYRLFAYQKGAGCRRGGSIYFKDVIQSAFVCFIYKPCLL
jgi:hypothetical protein